MSAFGDMLSKQSKTNWIAWKNAAVINNNVLYKLFIQGLRRQAVDNAIECNKWRQWKRDFAHQCNVKAISKKAQDCIGFMILNVINFYKCRIASVAQIQSLLYVLIELNKREDNRQLMLKMRSKKNCTCKFCCALLICKKTKIALYTLKSKFAIKAML